MIRGIWNALVFFALVLLILAVIVGWFGFVSFPILETPTSYGIPRALQALEFIASVVILMVLLVGISRLSDLIPDYDQFVDKFTGRR